MLIAGEASGDTLAAGLVAALRARVVEAESAPTQDVQPLRTALVPRFFGAGGPNMAAAGVELAFDLTQHSVIGLSDVLTNYLKFRRLFRRLVRLAIERQPDAILCVDFSGFNRRFAHAIRGHVRRHKSAFRPWNPRLIQHVSPQVWASRPGRAYQLAEDYDLLLSIFPFEKEWYARRVPKLRVEFVGHPLRPAHGKPPVRDQPGKGGTTVLLLPGSRTSELRRHLPVILPALDRIQANRPDVKANMVLPGEALAQLAKSLGARCQIQIGGLPQALADTDVAIASTGTVTMECALHGVPAVTLYRTSWTTYQIARHIVSVKWLTMPNLLAGEEIFPEFVQNAATPENLARAALELLEDQTRRDWVKTRLAEVVAGLGRPGANARAADCIVRLLNG